MFIFVYKILYVVLLLICKFKFKYFKINLAFLFINVRIINCYQIYCWRQCRQWWELIWAEKNAYNIIQFQKLRNMKGISATFLWYSMITNQTIFWCEFYFENYNFNRFYYISSIWRLLNNFSSLNNFLFIKIICNSKFCARTRDTGPWLLLFFFFNHLQSINFFLCSNVHF